MAAGDGPASGPGAAAGRGRRQRRPTGEPPPPPRPVAITATAWLALAAGLAVAFVVAQRTLWLRADERAGTWVLRQLAVIRTPWLTEVANGINVAASGWAARRRPRAAGGRTLVGLPARIRAGDTPPLGDGDAAIARPGCPN